MRRRLPAFYYVASLVMGGAWAYFCEQAPPAVAMAVCAISLLAIAWLLAPVVVDPRLGLIVFPATAMFIWQAAVALPVVLMISGGVADMSIVSVALAAPGGLLIYGWYWVPVVSVVTSLALNGFGRWADSPTWLRGVSIASFAIAVLANLTLLAR